MPANKTQARDDIHTIATAALVGQTGLQIDYWDAEDRINKANVNDEPPEWVKLVVQMLDGRSLTVGRASSRIQQRTGLFVAQIYTPLGDGQDRAEVLSELLEAAFFEQTSTNGVRFRNVRTEDIGRVRKWFLTEVKVDIEFDQYR